MSDTAAPASATGYKYWAFISYSHQDNLATRGDGRVEHIQWANWLHEQFETYRIPDGYRDRSTRSGEPMPERFFPTFRDEAELPTSHDLGGQIRDALERSRFLIVIASPRSARSRYVNEEVRHFRQLGRGDRILTLIVDGEPNVRLAPKAGWTADDDCFCPALVHPLRPDGEVDTTRLLREEPIAADVRAKDVEPPHEMRASERDQPDRRALLDFMKLKLIAGLMGVGLDELVQRDKVRQLEAARLRATTLRRWLGVVAVLTIAALTVGGIAYVQRNRALTAESERKEQSERRRLLLEEASRSDRLVAEEKLRARDEQTGFAYLARACEYHPQSSLAAEKASAALNDWSHPLPALVFQGHQGDIESAEFSPDSTRIITASKDKNALVWDAASGKVLATLTGHQGAVYSAQFSRDGSRIVTASEDKTVRVWDAASGKGLITLTENDYWVRSAEFSPDGSRVAIVSGDDKARVWDVVSGKMLTMLTGHGLFGVRFSPDGTHVLTVQGMSALVSDATTGKVTATLTGHVLAILEAQYSSDGTYIVTASMDKTARVWDAASGQSMVTLTGHGGVVQSAQFSQDGTRIATASMDKTARVWDAASGQPLVTLTGHENNVYNAQFSRDGTRIVTTSQDKTARVWDAASGKLLATLTDHAVSRHTTLSAQFSPDGTRIVTIAGDSIARVWDVAGEKVVAASKSQKGPGRHPRDGSGTSRAQFNRDGTRIVTASGDNPARVWDAAGGKLLATLGDHRGGHQDDAQSARFSPDGTCIVTVRGNMAKIWDAKSGKELLVAKGREDILRGHAGQLRSAEFSRDGSRIVTASLDGTARVWETSTCKLLSVLPGVGSARLSPDGTRIVTASKDNTAQVWDAASGKVLATLTGEVVAKLPLGDGGVLSAEFSPDGTRIVAVTDDIVRVWDAAGGKVLATLTGYEGGVLSAHFSSDGARIVTASAKSGRVWDAASGKVLAMLTGHEGEVWSAEFSTDGTRVVTASEDNTARVWDTAGGEMLATLKGEMVASLTGYETGMWSAEFSPDGTRIVTVTDDNVARVWKILPARAGPPPDWFADFLRYMAQRRLSSDGELVWLSLDGWLTLREKLRGVLRTEAGKTTPYLDILRRCVRE